ncbi:uncharacterized protein TNCV_3609921 [Trichonephila clavipes]|nr:uncharacterized protein TNCV_3609921 [Trichonephila clavipes]
MIMWNVNENLEYQFGSGTLGKIKSRVSTDISGQTAYKQYYIEILTVLQEKVRKKARVVGSDGWLLHQDNAPTHTALSVKQFLTSKNIAVMGYLPYSPDLASCDSFLCSTVKSCLKDSPFSSVEEVRQNGEFPEKPSKTLVPELLPATTARNAEVCEC